MTIAHDNDWNEVERRACEFEASVAKLKHLPTNPWPTNSHLGEKYNRRWQVIVRKTTKSTD